MTPQRPSDSIVGGRCGVLDNPSRKTHMRLLLTWLINAAALMALPYLMHSVSVDNLGAALVAAYGGATGSGPTVASR